MNQVNLKGVLELHQKWLCGDPDGGRANLREANLSGANLYRANLYGANLREANLSGANLYGANLREANLSGANLSWANLSWANLFEANLSWANLSWANLSWANLSWANLREANLFEVDLRGANLSEADLFEVDLRGANLSEADLSGVRNFHFFVCPPNGSFVAYKKLIKGLIAVLEIPAHAERVSTPIGRKCRASEALVLDIIDLSGETVKVGFSRHNTNFKYEVGEVVSVANFCDDIRVECAPGIHFFMTYEEAESW